MSRIRKIAVGILLATTSMIGIAGADEDDDYVDCVLNTAANVMKHQVVKDAAKALDEARKKCPPPARPA
jgi:prophage tail gpP-like protein